MHNLVLEKLMFSSEQAPITMFTRRPTRQVNGKEATYTASQKLLLTTAVTKAPLCTSNGAILCSQEFRAVLRCPITPQTAPKLQVTDIKKRHSASIVSNSVPH